MNGILERAATLGRSTKLGVLASPYSFSSR
jgi:hypothetical protein